MELRTNSDVQKFKARRRKALAEKVAKGQIQISDFTLAAANTIKQQPLEVDMVEILENEICPD